MSIFIQSKTIFFLKQLKNNNNREWFETNKQDYLQAKINMEQFGQSLAEQLASDKAMKGIDPTYKLFRIFRDARFSKNKDPYKTNFGLLWGDNHKERSVFYLHCEPNHFFIGGGIYCPEPRVLKAVRTKLTKDYKTFEDIVNDKNHFKKYFSLEGDQLKTTPKGIHKDHPALEWLRYKDYLGTASLTEQQVLATDFQQECYQRFKALYPFICFLRT